MRQNVLVCIDADAAGMRCFKRNLGKDGKKEENSGLHLVAGEKSLLVSVNSLARSSDRESSAWCAAAVGRETLPFYLCTSNDEKKIGQRGKYRYVVDNKPHSTFQTKRCLFFLERAFSHSSSDITKLCFSPKS